MQKRAFSLIKKEKEYITRLDPLPVTDEVLMYHNEMLDELPCSKEILLLHYHEYYEIGICVEGDGLILSDGIFYSVSPGDVFFVSPNCKHYSRSLHPDAPCRCRFFFINASAISDALVKFGDDLLVLLDKAKFIPGVIHASDHPEVVKMLSEIIEVGLAKNPYYDIEVVLRLAIFILSIDRYFSDIEDHATVNPPIRIKVNKGIAKVAEYISINYNQSSTANELADLCHLSESQLRRQFISVYGMPPIAYRNRTRCLIAREFLSRTTLPIAEISEQLGYKNSSDFYRAFRKTMGVSPSNYRNECIKK